MKSIFLTEEADQSIEEITRITRLLISELNRLENENLSLKSDVSELTEKLDKWKDECYELRNELNQKINI